MSTRRTPVYRVRRTPPRNATCAAHGPTWVKGELTPRPCGAAAIAAVVINNSPFEVFVCTEHMDVLRARATAVDSNSQPQTVASPKRVLFATIVQDIQQYVAQHPGCRPKDLARIRSWHYAHPHSAMQTIVQLVRTGRVPGVVISDTEPLRLSTVDTVSNAS